MSAVLRYVWLSLMFAVRVIVAFAGTVVILFGWLIGLLVLLVPILLLGLLISDLSWLNDVLKGYWSPLPPIGELWSWAIGEGMGSASEGTSSRPCAHTALVPHWDRADDMGKPEKAEWYRCQSCNLTISPEEGQRLSDEAAERVRQANIERGSRQYASPTSVTFSALPTDRSSAGTKQRSPFKTLWLLALVSIIMVVLSEVVPPFHVWIFWFD